MSRSPGAHHLWVHAVPGGGQQVVCACGDVLSRRVDDAARVSLSDLLELVRIHSNQINYPS